MRINNWQPTSSDITWTRNLVNMVKDGGRWCVPVTGTVYRIFHDKKLAVTNSEISDVTDKRIVKVFHKMGWTVEINE